MSYEGDPTKNTAGIPLEQVEESIRIKGFENPARSVPEAIQRAAQIIEKIESNMSGSELVVFGGDGAAAITTSGILFLRQEDVDFLDTSENAAVQAALDQLSDSAAD